ncbi:MAG: hypothetical protein IKD81_06360, partial [Eubacteriaceae bacterium]|nr:hypothetical protein [Eubacteriaceae bacterium]
MVHIGRIQGALEWQLADVLDYRVLVPGRDPVRQLVEIDIRGKLPLVRGFGGHGQDLQKAPLSNRLAGVVASMPSAA